MFIQTITEDMRIFAIDRDKRTDIINTEYWEVYDFNDPTTDELKKYETFLKEQIERIKEFKKRLTR